MRCCGGGSHIKYDTYKPNTPFHFCECSIAFNCLLFFFLCVYNFFFIIMCSVSMFPYIFLLWSHLLFLAGNRRQYGLGVIADSSGTEPWGSKSPRDTGGCWPTHTYGTSPSSGGQPGGSLVFDLLQQLFHLMGGWPERRVEDSGALKKEREGGREGERLIGNVWDWGKQYQYKQCAMIRCICVFITIAMRKLLL